MMAKQAIQRTVTENHDLIVRLIRVLAKPYSMLVYPFEVDGEVWDGIRIYEHSYELFSVYECSKEEKDEIGAEELEYVLSSWMITEEEEEKLRIFLEDCLAQ